MIKRIFLASALTTVALWAAGCRSTSEYDNKLVEAVYTATPVKIDGILDEEIWTKAPGYTFNAYNAECVQNGLIKFAWDDQYVYVGAQLTDDDVVTISDKDQSHLYKDGDLLEVFLKPLKDTYYWEIYANPLNARASFFIAGGGRLISDEISREGHLMKDLKVFAKIDGTVNNWQDIDNGWSVEMAIPIKELTRYGAELKENSVWRFLIGRYNYSRYLENSELSGITEFKDNNRSFHHKPSYGYMKFVK
jgi:hypothetical protein